MPKYAMLLRPASTFSLPPRLEWDFAEVPAALAQRRPELPVSTEYPHGVIVTKRTLTSDEIERFDLKLVD